MSKLILAVSDNSILTKLFKGQHNVRASCGINLKFKSQYVEITSFLCLCTYPPACTVQKQVRVVGSTSPRELTTGSFLGFDFRMMLF